MEIIIGKTSGFCGGVLRSITQTEKLLAKYKSIYCLGELVHNKEVVSSLVNKGLTVIDNLNDCKSQDNVIIRAHGVSKETYELAKNKNLNIFDLTCPKVLLIHDLAKELVSKGYFIILLGAKDHPEVIGTISFCGINSMVVYDDQDLPVLYKKINKSGANKLAIIAQTTYSIDKYNEIEKQIKKEYGNKYEVYSKNTICAATEMRQKETKEIAAKVDAMIIVGGKNSSNTKKLYDIANKLCKNSYIVETAADLNEDFSSFKTIGIMAGASTPKESVDTVIEYLKK